MKRFVLSLALVCATSVWAAPEWIRGEIIKLAPETGQVTLKHEATKGMDGMTMPYKMVDANALKGFKAGDAVRFTIKLKGDQMLAESLEHAK